MKTVPGGRIEQVAVGNGKDQGHEGKDESLYGAVSFPCSPRRQHGRHEEGAEAMNVGTSVRGSAREAELSATAPVRLGDCQPLAPTTGAGPL